MPEASAREALFLSLFEDHVGYVQATLRRIGVGASDLDDLTQDVFVAVHGAIAEYDVTRPAKPWLFAFCHRVASNHRRLARHRRELADDRTDGAATSAPSPEDEASAAQARLLLGSALNALSDEHRAIFVMFDIDGASGPEVAEALGIPLNTAYSRIRVARQIVEAALRELADERGFR